MRISIIGAGRVAFHLAQGLNGQHELVQIYSRSFAKAEQLASKFKAQAINAPQAAAAAPVSEETETLRTERSSSATNFDILRRLNRLEKEVFGKQIAQD